MNLANHLRRSVLAAAVATTIAVGVAGTTRADTALTVSAAPVTQAAHAPPPNGTTLAAAAAPTAPRSVTATSGNQIVKLAWRVPSSNGGGAINKYRVQRARAGGSWKTIAHRTTRSYTATGLTNGVRYYFRIAAHNRAGWGSFSAAVKAVPRTVPSAPRTPVATPGNASVKLTWQPPSSNGSAAINHYRVQRARTGGPWKTIAYPTTRSYTAGGLTNGVRYYFRIAAHNTVGYGPASTVVSAVPRTKPSAPRSPAAVPGYGTVTLTWSAPSSTGGAKIDKYAVQWAPSAAGPWVHVDDTIAKTYTATGIDNSVANNFRIRAHNAAGWSAPSTVVDTPVPVFAPGPPSAPLACSASQVGIFGSHSMAIAWQPPFTDGGSAITGYIVDLNGPLSLGLWLPPSPLHYQRDNLPSGYYMVRVAAVNAVGKSPWCTDDAAIN
jgi:predicted phage tail protein